MTTSACPLRIVHVVFSSRLAGGERHCLDLAQAQAALGHEVHVVATRGSKVESAVGAGIRFHGIALPIGRGARLRALVDRLGADVCHGHLGPACKAVARTRAAARIGTLHVGYKPHQHDLLDGLICVNGAQRHTLARYHGLACTVHNWAPQRPSTTAPSSLRAELGLQADQLLVGSVGRLNAAKGMDTLITAFRAEASQDIVLAILGEGEELSRLRRLANGDDRIRFLGFRDDVDAALGEMDLFVSASREEAFPLAILEAMRAGLPIVSTATQGPLEMLRGTRAAVVPVGDPLELGRAIRSALEALRAVPRDRRRPVPYDLSRFDRDEAVGRVIDFYRLVMSRVTGGAD